MKQTILIFGNTCTGKSSLGKELELKLSYPYISFGDIKRLEIKNKTILSQRILSATGKEFPIDPLDGLTLITEYEKKTQSPILTVSGYSISIKEYNAFISSYAIIVGIHLRSDEQTIRKRFFSRAVCPVCNLPGILGSKCKIHHISMVTRGDVSENEFVKRNRLYTQRIIPFLEHVRNNSLFQIKEYNTSTHNLEMLLVKIVNSLNR